MLPLVSEVDAIKQSRPAWGTVDFYVLLALTLVALALRLWNLGTPAEIVFDETYYAKDACWYVEASPTVCDDITREQTDVHPPLGKWLLALGIRIFGYDAFGWRFMAAVAGAATVAILYVLARRLLGTTPAATIAAGLFALDPLHFVQSRIAMLDVFVPLFGLAAVLFAVLDRDRLVARMRGDPPEQEEPHGLLDRPWRLFAGLAGGAATASKWSGGFYVLMVLILAVTWELAARRADGRGRWFARTFMQEHRSIFLWLCIVPVLTYSLTYVGRLDGDLLATPWKQGSWTRTLFDRQNHMWTTHQDIDQDHVYQSPAWSWPLLRRPVAYAYCSGDKCEPAAKDGEVAEILATGSPFVWWSSLIALVLVGLSWLRRRDPTAAQGVILSGFLVNWLPWLTPWLERPAIFLFYMLPAVPFMYLALGWVASRLGRSWEAWAAHALFAAGAIGSFVFYFPLLANVQISQQEWDRRVGGFPALNVHFNQCDKETGPPSTTTMTTTIDGSVTTTSSVIEGEASPPEGWCWI